MAAPFYKLFFYQLFFVVENFKTRYNNKKRNAYQEGNMDSKERLIQIKEASGMNWKEFSAYIQIPYRTVQDWERGNRKMPEYLLRLMEYKLRIEKIIE